MMRRKTRGREGRIIKHTEEEKKREKRRRGKRRAMNLFYAVINTHTALSQEKTV